METAFTIVSGLAIIAAVFALYFLPLIVAYCRDHPNTLGIAILNIMLGWTLIGWVVALIWAVLQERPRQVIIVSPEARRPATVAEFPRRVS